MNNELATITETGPGGQCQANRDHGWGAVLADGTPLRVFITAKVHSLKIPILHQWQVIRIDRHLVEPDRCSVAVADIAWVSPSKLARLIASNAATASSTRE